MMFMAFASNVWQQQCTLFACDGVLPISRYLQESGFVHSSFTFVYESMLGRANMRNAERSIPPGALVSFLQKGLQYVGIEETLQREQQRGNASIGNKRSKAGNLNDANLETKTKQNRKLKRSKTGN